MDKKERIRKNYILKRKKKFFQINEKFFGPLISLFKKNLPNKRLNISLYYPSSFEVDVFKILDVEYFKKFKFLLPVINKSGSMNFYPWERNEILLLNKYGIPEPIKTKKIVPSVILLPMLAFDKNKNRIGYGKGFYDRYLARFLKVHKKILTVGVAFSFQKYHKLPVNSKDFKLDCIITEKGILK